MADSFFGFDTTLERDAMDDNMSDEDEDDYDALNDETFGGDVLDGDWEEDHEKLAEIAERELSKSKGVFQENGDLGAKIAAFILDDELEKDHLDEKNGFEISKPLRPPPGFNSVATINHHPPHHPDLIIQTSRPPLPNFKQMCTVEEIERNLIKQSNNAPSFLEEIERNLMSKPLTSLPGGGQMVSYQPHSQPGGLGGLSILARPHPLLGKALPPLPPHSQPPHYSPHFSPVTSIPPPNVHHPVASSLFPHSLQSGVRLGGAGPNHPLLRLAPGLARGIPQLAGPPHSSPHPLSNQTSVPPHPRLPQHLQQTRQPPPLHQHHSPQPEQQGPVDEYAGLMTQKEKQWLATIQLIQVSTSNPYHDDYYYMMYQHRQGSHGRKGNMKLTRDQPSLTKSNYTPLQFENSLGKLQVGSVVAPRKIIDTDVVESVESHISITSSKKFKQILLEIEHLFSSVLAAEEVLSPLTNSNVENVDPSENFKKAVNSLLKEDKLKTVLSIRKGKTLVLRVLPHTEVSDPLAERLISVLPVVIKRDPEQALLRALPSIRHCLSAASLSLLNVLASHLAPHLPSLIEHKLGISVITNMMERAESVLSSGQNEGSAEWLEFVSSVVEATSDTEGPIERPVVGINREALSRHLARLPPSLAASRKAQLLQQAISISA